MVRIQAAISGGAPSEGVLPLEADSSAGKAESTALGEVRAAVHGGFVMVADNKVTIVAGVAELADEIDLARARRALEAAESAESAEARQPTGGQEEAAASASATAAASAAAARARARLEAASALDTGLSRV